MSSGFVFFTSWSIIDFHFLDQTQQYNAASAQSPAPVPQQSQAAFAPSPMNQYAANPAPFQPADPNMMNAVAKSDVPENAQVRIHCYFSLFANSEEQSKV